MIIDITQTTKIGRVYRAGSEPLKVEKAKRLTNEYNGLKGEYMKYIHEKDVEPEPENVEDKEDVVEEEEKEEKEEE